MAQKVIPTGRQNDIQGSHPAQTNNSKILFSQTTRKIRQNGNKNIFSNESLKHNNKVNFFTNTLFYGKCRNSTENSPRV